MASRSASSTSSEDASDAAHGSRLTAESSHRRAQPPEIAPSPRSVSEISSQTLFAMGFPDDEVGRALVSARGDATKALQVLRASKASNDGETGALLRASNPNDDDDDDLQQALKLSLEPPSPAKRQKAANSSANFWAPPRYVPSSSRGLDRLDLVEAVEVRDGGYAWTQATAFLDTGNQHMTIVDARFAARHALYRPDLCPSLGSSFGQAERWTTLHGVVPGASSRAPCVTIALRVRGHEFVIQAAVSEMGGGHDLLLGVDVLDGLFAAGFQIGSGSMLR